MKKFYFQIIVSQNRYTKKKFQKEKSRTCKRTKIQQNDMATTSNPQMQHM